jgi:rod shape-determining protein MreC
MESSRDDFVIAIRSAFLKKGTQQRFSLLGLIFFSIIFLTLGSFNFKVIEYVKIGIKEIVYRSSFIVSGPENFVKKNYTDIRNHLKLYEENQKNIIELKNLRSKNLSNQILILENDKYKKLIDDYFIKDNEVFAKVLIDKQSPFLRSVVLNKGSRHNIKLGMVVLDGAYLVGKIVEVNYITSRVLLLPDINSKIPVSLQPGDTQAIMSGNGKQKGKLQYVKNKDLIKNEELLVLSSGAGGLFKSGIPIGKISKVESASTNNEKTVDFNIDFTQLKYVKVVSFAKEKKDLDQLPKTSQKETDKQIAVINKEEESLRVLLEQKKIEDEVRLKIEEENNILKKKITDMQNQIIDAKKTIEKNKIQNANIKFLEMNFLYGKNCRKTFMNKLYKEGTDEYRDCVLNKGKVKKN